MLNCILELLFLTVGTRGLAKNSERDMGKLTGRSAPAPVHTKSKSQSHRAETPLPMRVQGLTNDTEGIHEEAPFQCDVRTFRQRFEIQNAARQPHLRCAKTSRHTTAL